MLPSEGELPASWGYSEGGWKWASMAYLPRNRADGDPVVICAGRTCWKWPPALPGALPWLQAGAWSFGCGLVESPLTLHFLTGCNARGQEPMNEAGRGVRVVGVSRLVLVAPMHATTHGLAHVSSFSVMLSLCLLLISLTHVSTLWLILLKSQDLSPTRPYCLLFVFLRTNLVILSYFIVHSAPTLPHANFLRREINKICGWKQSNKRQIFAYGSWCFIFLDMLLHDITAL